MVSYSAQYQFFARDKQGFLTSQINSTADARRWAEGGEDDKRRYKFLADNKTLIEQETVSAEEFQMMLVQFNTQCVSYEVIGEEINREKLPFQNMPETV